MWHNLFISLILFFFSASDDNLLKNLELFDKLSLRFSGRVLFLKDVIGSQEICLWSFFGHGKKVAEVCCTSIVYATDKKHTKVKEMKSLFALKEIFTISKIAQNLSKMIAIECLNLIFKGLTLKDKYERIS